MPDPFDFSGLMNGPVSPGLGLTIAQNPEALALEAARRGIPPPMLNPQMPTDLTAPNPNQSFGALLSPPSPVTPQPAAPPPVANAVPIPQGDISEPTEASIPFPRPRPESFGPGAAATPDVTTTPANRLLQTLRGVQAIPQPQIQKINTPAAPRPHGNVKTGELLALLELLNPSSSAGGGLKLPPTLGSALGGR